MLTLVSTFLHLADQKLMSLQTLTAIFQNHEKCKLVHSCTKVFSYWYKAMNLVYIFPHYCDAMFYIQLIWYFHISWAAGIPYGLRLIYVHSVFPSRYWTSH